MALKINCVINMATNILVVSHCKSTHIHIFVNLELARFDFHKKKTYRYSSRQITLIQIFLHVYQIASQGTEKKYLNLFWSFFF